MAGVLTTGSAVTCAHQGTVETSSTAKLQVDGRPVLRKADVQGKAVKNCVTKDTNTTKTCTAVQGAVPGSPGVAGGEATRLTVGGAPVLLGGPAGLTGSTDGMVGGTTPQPGLSGSADQDKLTAT